MALVAAGLAMRLVNEWQSGFPLVPAPYAVVAQALKMDEADVIASLASKTATGEVSRIGAVFRPGTVGVSTLAAMRVPQTQLVRVATAVSARPEVNHNYEREHRLNLWFVVTAADAAALSATLAAIAGETGLLPLSLPLVDDYWIDLSFDLGDTLARDRTDVRNRRSGPRPMVAPISLTPADRALVDALDHGLPLVPRPYAQIAAQTGDTEACVLARLSDWLDRGVVKRFGIVVRHRALGYTANAMCVWDVPDDTVTALGEALAREPGVTLCYRRERALPQWRYNLYCMIHGRDRAVVEARVARLTDAHRLGRFPHAVLFSRRAFKQRGARYALARAVA